MTFGHFNSNSRKQFVLRRSPVAVAVSLALATPSVLAASMPPFPPGSALGSVITVNSAPNGAANITTGRSVASDAAGDFVVVWYGTSAPNTNAVVFAQLYQAGGSQNGSVITVSSNANNNFVPAVAMDASGAFVVVWAAGGSAKNQTTTILAQRYSADGTPQGALIQVANSPNVLQTFPSVAMDASGNFVVTWTSGTTSTPFTVFAQPYNASGSPIGGRLTVGTNPAAASINPSPSVAMDANGDFVLAWAGYNATYTNVPAIFAEQCSPPSNATQCKTAFTVSGDRANKEGRYVPSVSMDAAGDFVVAWQENTYIKSNLSVFNIHAQRYNPQGAAQGTEITVTNSSSVPQQLPSISLDALGDFVITWQAGTSVTPPLTFAAQRYNSQGITQGTTIQVSQSPTSQTNPSVSLNADGDFVLAWGVSQTTAYNIYAQRYEGPESIDLASTGLVAAPTTVDTGASFNLSYALANNSQVGTVVNSAVNASINLANPGAQVSIPLPSGVSFVSASGSNWTCPTPNNGALICTYNTSIKASSVASLLTLTLKAPSAAGTINFTATVTGQQPDPNANNNSASSGNITVQTSGTGGGGGGSGYGGGGGGGALGFLSLLLIAPLVRIRRRRQDS